MRRRAKPLATGAAILLLAIAARPLGAGAPTCGDGVLDPAHEACDDGNNVSGDGCEADCHILTHVALTGDDATGDGSAGRPYRTIQRAFERAGSFYTILVDPGSYNECVTAGPPVAVDRPVSIVARAWLDDGDNTATVVSGDGVCDASRALADRAPVIELRSRESRLEGFTITRGGASGVIGSGSVVITNNVITDNRSSVGGGIYLDLRGSGTGDLLAEIRDNVITGNRVDFGPAPNSLTSVNSGDGGGVFVSAIGDTYDVDVRIEGNTIEGNIIDEDSSDEEVSVFGGGLGVATDSATGSAVRVVVTRNVITGNGVDAGAEGFSGGAWVYTFGYGSETIDIVANTFEDNHSPLYGGGLSAWISTAGTRADGEPGNDSDIRHTINVTGNEFRNNRSSNGGGVDLFLRAQGLRDDERAQINAARNIIIGNSAFGGAAGYGGGGGGGLVALTSVGSATPDTGIVLEDNTIQYNIAGISGGGVGVVVTADAGAVTPSPAVGRVDLVGNLITDNDASTSLAGGGGVFAYLEAYGSAVSTLAVDRSTIAGNTADYGAGGIHVETFTGEDSPPTSVAATHLSVRNSIVANNDLVGIGGPIPGLDPGILAPDGHSGRILVSVAYSDVFGHPGGNYDVWFPNPSGRNGNISKDPLFGARWRVGSCSPTIDAADPALDFSLEPSPNGGRANMGHTGGTAGASIGLADPTGDDVIDGLDILKLSVAFGASAGDPRYDAAVDVNADGVVDGADLALVAGDFGTSCAS